MSTAKLLEHFTFNLCVFNLTRNPYKRSFGALEFLNCLRLMIPFTYIFI